MLPVTSKLLDKSISPSPPGDEKALAYIVQIALMLPLAVICYTGPSTNKLPLIRIIFVEFGNVPIPQYLFEAVT